MKTVQYADISGIPGVSADWRVGVALTDRWAAVKKKWKTEMGINGIGTAGYPLTEYMARKTGRSAESGAME